MNQFTESQNINNQILDSLHNLRTFGKNPKIILIKKETFDIVFSPVNHPEELAEPIYDLMYCGVLMVRTEDIDTPFKLI